MNRKVAEILVQEKRESDTGIITLSWYGVEALVAEIERLEREAIEGPQNHKIRPKQER